MAHRPVTLTSRTCHTLVTRDCHEAPLRSPFHNFAPWHVTLRAMVVHASFTNDFATVAEPLAQLASIALAACYMRISQ
jgi:hypothetical protein